MDSTGLKLTLFQYQTCPFCCKVSILLQVSQQLLSLQFSSIISTMKKLIRLLQVRVLLDYYGIPYDIVEVDPVLRKEISWSSYKKVPILLSKVEGGYQPLNDSSMIVSLISSYLNDKSYGIDELVKFYPSITVSGGKGLQPEIVNKYFLMFKNGVPKGKTLHEIV